MAYRINETGRDTTFQYRVPLVVDKACLECHKDQGFTKGTVGGGLSVFLPICKMKASLASDHLRFAAAGVGLIVITIVTLFILMRRMVIQPLNHLKDMTGRILDGNLGARVDLTTGDEIEKLGDAFNSMASRLSEGRVLLEEKIRQAIQELADTNREL